MTRIDSFDKLYSLVAGLSETTSDPDLMEAFNLVSALHQPTRWVAIDHLDEASKHAEATSLVDALQAAPHDLREALDLRALADLLGDLR